MGKKSRLKQERKMMSLINNESEILYEKICSQFAEIPYKDRALAFYQIMDEIAEQNEVLMERGDKTELLFNLSMEQALIKFGAEQGYFQEEIN